MLNANTLIGITLICIAFWGGNQSTDPLLAMSIILAVLGGVCLMPRPMIKMLRMSVNEAAIKAALEDLKEKVDAGELEEAEDDNAS